MPAITKGLYCPTCLGLAGSVKSIRHFPGRMNRQTRVTVGAQDLGCRARNRTARFAPCQWTVKHK